MITIYFLLVYWYWRLNVAAFSINNLYNPDMSQIQLQFAFLYVYTWNSVFIQVHLIYTFWGLCEWFENIIVPNFRRQSWFDNLTFRKYCSSLIPHSVLLTVSLSNIHILSFDWSLWIKQFLQRTKKQSTVYTYNLYVMMKNVVCKIGENSEVMMSLYDGKLCEHIR